MITEIAVVVPASNEENDIARCLTALTAACRAVGQRSRDTVTARVIVALDRCVDGTAAVVADFADVYAVVVDAGTVGGARRAGTAEALRRCPPNRLTSTWIAGTDADCEVPVEWLSRMVEHADRGVDLLLGTVVPDALLAPGTAERWNAEHDRTDGHPHVHGANLGIRASSYAALGGWSPLACHEDVDLLARARAFPGIGVHATGDPPVVTSSRLHGRIEHGFAGYLRALGEHETELAGVVA